MSDEKSPVRRRVARLSAIALAAASVGFSQAASAQTPASELESEFLLELLLDVDASIDAGHTRIAPVTGESFSGPGIRGRVHGGADWITQVSGHSSLDVRITLETDDGELIYMSYTGTCPTPESFGPEKTDGIGEYDPSSRPRRRNMTGSTMLFS